MADELLLPLEGQLRYAVDPADGWTPPTQDNEQCPLTGQQQALTDADIVIGANPKPSEGGNLRGDLKKWWAAGNGGGFTADWFKGLWNLLKNWLMQLLGVAEKIAVVILAALALVALAGLWFVAEEARAAV